MVSDSISKSKKLIIDTTKWSEACLMDWNKVVVFKMIVKDTNKDFF